MADDFETEIKKDFITEALLNLEDTEGSFMELEAAKDSKPLLDKIFRLAHNLKGGSRAVGFGDVAEFTHKLENLVLKIQLGEVSLSPEIVTTLLKCNDRLIEMLNALKQDLNARSENQDLLTEIEAWTSNSMPSPSPNILGPINETAVVEAPEPMPPPSAEFIQEEVATPAPKLSEPTASAASSTATAKNTSTKDDEVVRVNISKINQLNDYVGELIVLQSVIVQQSSLGEIQKLQISMRQMNKISKEIQNLAMSLRMLPVKPLVQKLQRVVRDTARALGKDVELELVGEQIEIDKSVLDQLGDPLIHILRNAVDHGLETTEERLAAGKNTQGIVQLCFFNEGNHLIVEARDDGKGIKADFIRKKAIEKGVIQESQSLTSKQIINLIFHPGFSTKTETSEISGRGVGMDVVKTNVEKIGGTVEVSTEEGKGSVFRLQIPLSLAVIEGLIVSTQKERYVIPLNQVQETVNLKTLKVFRNQTGIGNCIQLRDKVIPVINFEEAMGQSLTAEARLLNQTALLINVRDQMVALCIFDVIRTQQIVIKPLGNGIESRQGFVGTCVLGDGMPALIISAVDLLKGKFITSYGKQNLMGAA